MSTNLIINENTNIRSDNCLNDFYIQNNDKLFNYSFKPSVLPKNETQRQSYINSTSTRGLLQNNNYDLHGDNINTSTQLRHGVGESDKSKKELDTRLFPGVPNLSNGQSTLKNPDLSSKLLFGEETRTSKSSNPLSSYSADNFIPLIPSIQENIQNVDHIIMPSAISTRSVIRNIDYLKSCGFKK
jgi:hypothetical protein